MYDLFHYLSKHVFVVGYEDLSKNQKLKSELPNSFLATGKDLRKLKQHSGLESTSISCARYQKGLSPLFSKIVLFEKTNQNGLTHIVGLRHPRIYVKNRRKHVVQNIEKGLSPNFFIILIKMD